MSKWRSFSFTFCIIEENNYYRIPTCLNWGQELFFKQVGIFVPDLDRQNTVYTVSLAIYYTPAFSATTSNVRGFLSNEVAEANVALTNTRLNLRLRIHCIQLIDLREQSTGSRMLAAFKAARGKNKFLEPTIRQLTFFVFIKTLSFGGFRYFKKCSFWELSISA